ncbi:hypothetical protein JHK85_028140 [Glycine max]|nr:hypothetical protein JHK85_028140 [Glycine max]
MCSCTFSCAPSFGSSSSTKKRKLSNKANVGSRNKKFKNDDDDEIDSGVSVQIWDVDTNSMHSLVFKRWVPSRSYVFIGNWIKDFVARRGLRKGDEIGFQWNPFKNSFDFCNIPIFVDHESMGSKWGFNGDEISLRWNAFKNCFDFSVLLVQMDAGEYQWGEYLPSSKSLEFLDEMPTTQNIAPGKVPPVAIIISHQNLRGDVSSISRLKALKWLDLSNTDFHGLIPPTFGNLFYLEYLDLSSNKFEGSIPPKLGALRSLKTLNLSNNLLVGEIPKELQGLESLQDFQIFNNHLSGLIPSWVGNWTNLRVFAAYENNFDGRVPSKLGFIYELKTLNLHSNHLEGPIPGRIFTSGKLEVLILTQNNLSCDLPVEIGNCQTLFSVRIGNNNLEGGVSLLDRPSNNSSSVLVKISRSSIVTRSKEAAGDAAFVAKKLLRSTGKATFAVRIPEAEIPNLIKTLRGFNDTKIEFKLANVQKIWQRFLYRDSVLLEAERRKS